MSDVLISYSRKDSDFVHKLDDALTREKRDVWIDWEDIARGEDWWHSIQTGIDSTDTALIVVTEHWLVSEICQRELEYIRQQNKRVFPIIRQKIEGDVALRVKGTWVDQEWEQRARDNWKYLRSVNWLFFDDDTTFETVFKDLLTALDTDQLYVKSHTRYLVRALEWQQFHRNPSFLLEGDQLESAKTWLDSSANKQPEPHPAHHEYVGASKIAETARIARDKAREALIRRFRQTAVILGVLVVVALIVAVVVGQQFFVARAEVTKAGATLQQVNMQVTAAINQQSTAAAQVQVAEALVATATIEQGNAVIAQKTSAAGEQAASTQVAVAGSTLSPVPPTLTAVASAISEAYVQQDIAAQIANASLLLVDKDYLGALQTMDDMVASYPDQALAYIGRGLMLDSLNKYDDAVADYTKAIELDPEESNGYINRANTYSKQDKFEKALADYTKAIELDPTEPDTYSDRGSLYGENGYYDEALADFDKALEMNPESLIAHIYRGALYENTGELDKALEDYQQAVKINPQSADAHNSIGTIYNQQGKLDEALTEFNRAIALNPQFATAYSGRGTVYDAQGKYDEAIADFETAINLEPKYADAYYNLGITYKNQDQLDLAVDAFTRSIALDPKYLNAYMNRALIYSQTGKVPEASADYLKWIELNQTAKDEAETVTQAQMPYNTTVEMTSGYVYAVPFEGKAGQHFEASAAAQVSEETDVDPLLVLVDSEGNALTFADDNEDNSDAILSDYTLPKDGLYTLLVSYSLSGSEGSVDVTLNLTAAPTPTPTLMPTATPTPKA